MSKKLLLPEFYYAMRHTHWVYDDFDGDQTDLTWLDTVTDTGTVTMDHVANGVMVMIPSDGSVADNDEAYAEYANETFLFANNKPLLFEASVQFTEANTDDANVFAGFMDAAGANSLVDDGAGPKTSYSGACIFKVDGGTVWKCQSSLGSSQTTTTSVSTAGGSAYQRLKIQVDFASSTVCEVSFFLDGAPLLDVNARPIKHNLTYTSATEMHPAFGVKNGGANLETLSVDWCFMAQSR